MPTLRAGRPEAAEAIWSWRQSAEEEAEAVSKIRIRGALQSAIGAAIGTVFFFFWSKTAAFTVLTIAALLFALSQLSPADLFAAVERGLRALGRRVAAALTWTLTVALFYSFVVPFGLMLRRGSRARLRRELLPSADSYWEKRPDQPSALEKQY